MIYGIFGFVKPCFLSHTLTSP